MLIANKYDIVRTSKHRDNPPMYLIKSIYQGQSTNYYNVKLCNISKSAEGDIIPLREFEHNLNINNYRILNINEISKLNFHYIRNNLSNKEWIEFQLYHLQNLIEWNIEAI